MASKVSHWPKLEVSFNDRPHIAFGRLVSFIFVGEGHLYPESEGLIREDMYGSALG